jgi:hypothetical protein
VDTTVAVCAFHSLALEMPTALLRSFSDPVGSSPSFLM